MQLPIFWISKIHLFWQPIDVAEPQISNTLLTWPLPGTLRAFMKEKEKGTQATKLAAVEVTIVFDCVTIDASQK